MTRFSISLCLVVSTLLAGCSSVPTCGTVAAYDAIGQPCRSPTSGALMGVPTSSRQSFGSFLTEYNAMQNPGRNYATNPITLPQQPQTTQPNFGAFGATDGETYQLIMVNTPAGLVQKRCKVLNGQVVACL